MPEFDKFVGASPFIPPRRTLPALVSALQSCEGCDLYLKATQAVFGEGPAHASIVMIGEQPGDEEDRRGHPFIGPAGRMLDRALDEAEIDRSTIYVTNAVKHFKFEERGKRRLHKKPRASEIHACEPWLEAEISVVKPQIIVCLGATAAVSIFGNQYRLTKERGSFVPHRWAPLATSTIHPSAILRSRDEAQRHAEYAHFLDDLKKVRLALEKRTAANSGASSGRAS